jgi:hypothetical protein
MAINLQNYDPSLKANAGITTTGAITAGNVTVTGTLTTGTQVITGAVSLTGALSATGGATVKSVATVPATAGAVAAGAPITMFSDGPSIYVTSDAPTFSAVKGSLCLNTGGSSTSTRLYVNNGTTNWVAITTAS